MEKRETWILIEKNGGSHLFPILLEMNNLDKETNQIFEGIRKLL